MTAVQPARHVRCCPSTKPLLQMLQKMTPSLAEYVLPAHNSHVAVDMTYLLPALHAFGGTHCVLAGLTELGELHAWHTTCPLVFVYVSPVHCSHVSDDATYLEPALHESWVTAAAAAVSSRATPRRRMEGRPPLLEDDGYRDLCRRYQR